MTVFTPRGPRVLLLLIAVAAAPAGVAGLELLGASYRADVPFPQFLPFWRESWDLKDSVTGETVQYAYQGMPVGGSVHLFLRNGGEEPLESDDVLLDGISLSRAVAFSSQVRKREFHPVSIHFADLSSAERGRLLSAGEPIWWRVDPRRVAPGGTAEALVPLRRRRPRCGRRLGYWALSFALAVRSLCEAARHQSRSQPHAAFGLVASSPDWIRSCSSASTTITPPTACAPSCSPSRALS